MITLPTIEEIVMLGVQDAGIPNQERIAMYVQQATNLGYYSLYLGLRADNGAAIPMRDNALWFGDLSVHPGDYILVYTGPGEARANPQAHSPRYVYCMHWGRKGVLFSTGEFVPMLIRMDGVRIPENMATKIAAVPKPQPQGAVA